MMSGMMGPRMLVRNESTKNTRRHEADDEVVPAHAVLLLLTALIRPPSPWWHAQIFLAHGRQCRQREGHHLDGQNLHDGPQDPATLWQAAGGCVDSAANSTARAPVPATSATSPSFKRPGLRHHPRICPRTFRPKHFERPVTERRAAHSLRMEVIDSLMMRAPVRAAASDGPRPTRKTSPAPCSNSANSSTFVFQSFRYSSTASARCFHLANSFRPRRTRTGTLPSNRQRHLRCNIGFA